MCSDVDVLDLQDDADRIGTLIHISRHERSERRIRLQSFLKFFNGLSIMRRFDDLRDLGEPVAENVRDDDNLIITHLAAH